MYFDFPAQPMADTLWVQLPLRHSDALLIGLIYRSPSSDLEKDCELWKSIRDFILSQHCSHLLLLGDFSAPDIMWDEGVSAGGFSSHLFHSVQKEAHASTIYKSGDRHSPVSYRHISLTSIPWEILERLIKKAVLTHLQRNELISDSQHGFLPRRSCTMNSLLYMDSLTQARDDGLISDTIFFDFAKAFDKVPHKPFLHKPQSYGVCGEQMQWINSFLTDRSFCVKVDQVLSSPAPVYFAVPQCIVLGPLLFLVYINNLVDVI